MILCNQSIISGGMNGYYTPQYQGHEFQPLGRSNTDSNVVSLGGDGMSTSSVCSNLTAENAEAAAKQRRRQSFPTSIQAQQAQVAAERHARRGSMVEFGGGHSTSQALNNFQFGHPSGTGSIIAPAATFQNISASAKAGQQLYLDTQYGNQDQTYADMVGSGSNYESPMLQTSRMDIDMNNAFFSQSMAMPMDYGDLLMNNFMSGKSPMNRYASSQYTSPMMESPVPQRFSNSMEDNNMGDVVDIREDTKDTNGSDQSNANNNSNSSNALSQHMSQGHAGLQRNFNVSHSPASQMMQNWSFNSGTDSLQQPQEINNDISWQSQPEFQSVMPTRPRVQSNYKNAYSSTGFDMLTVLMRVATRTNPEINIGAVDLSCSFVVCDVDQHDSPIVYCSDNFERLTGYTKHEILGRNCRFLQSPNGKVQQGVKRKYVDDDSVLYLKNMIVARREAQISLINYRKGGQPFMNLLTMIPITYDSDEIKFFVGFQVDLVEQPNSVTNKNPDGTYSINYQRGLTMPRYVFSASENTQPKLESGQTVTRDDVSTVLSTIGTEDSELSKRIWDKVLLENTDDVVHVLSLKGLFMYLSPSCKKVLEYEAHELVGTALSSICHPSDIVPVTRELKETSSTSSVDIVYRIRRKNSGYMWFEGYGALHTDQGKGRKCIILVGRERPVYTLAKSNLEAAGGIGDNELWSKISTSGMFLYVSSNVKALLDLQPDDLIGTSMQALMRPDSKIEFGRILELVRTGKKAELKHEILNKRGQTLQVFSTIYPGDAGEGAKPTFMVAQTRLLKYSRNSSQQKNRTSALATKEPDSRTSSPALKSIGSPMSNQGTVTQRASTSSSMNLSMNHFSSTTETPMTHCGQDGLVLGRQDIALASDDNVFDELKTTRSTSWQFELRQMEKSNRLLTEEVQSLLAQKKKRKRRKGAGQMEKDCANCHTRVTPEWRRGPSGNRDLCNSCGLRWAKQQGRVSPRNSSQRSVQSEGESTVPKRSKDQADLDGITDSKTPNATTANPSNDDGHTSKMAKKESSPTHGTAVPAKIEEGIEPD